MAWLQDHGGPLPLPERADLVARLCDVNGSRGLVLADHQAGLRLYGHYAKWQSLGGGCAGLGSAPVLQVVPAPVLGGVFALQVQNLGGGLPVMVTGLSTFAAIAKNQSQKLRNGRWNQSQLRPPESGGSTPPSTARRAGRPRGAVACGQQCVVVPRDSSEPSAAGRAGLQPARRVGCGVGTVECRQGHDRLTLRALALARLGRDDAQSETVLAKSFKFLFVGGLNTLVFYGVYVLLVWLGCHYSLALVLEYCGGIVTGYVMNRHWTFAGHGRTNRDFPKYLAANGGAFVLNMLLLGAIVESGLMGPVVGQIAAIGIASVASFLLQNYWVFRRPAPR
ncbi:MAG: GtrA family protein [Planctomycetota bacterium]